MPHTTHRTVALRTPAYWKACEARRLTTIERRCKALGVSRSTLLRMESGESAPSPSFMAAVLDVLAESHETAAWHRFFRVVTRREALKSEESNG